MFLVYVFLAQAIAFPFSNRLPCWVTSPCGTYTPDMYLIGMGSGYTIEDADASAISGISRQFSVNIKQVQTSTKEISQTNRDAKNVSSVEHQDLRNNVVVESNMTLSRVQIVEHHNQKLKAKQHDGHKQRVYSLAVIEKAPWLREIDQERMSLQSSMTQIEMDKRKTEQYIERVPLYRAYIELLSQDIALYNQRKIIDASGNMPVNYTMEQITTNIAKDKLSQNFTVHLDSPTRDTIENALRNYGLRVVEKEPSIEIHCTENRTQTPTDSFGFVKISSEIQCAIQLHDQIIGNYTKTSTSSSRDAQKAERTLDTVITEDCRALYEQLYALLLL